MLVSFLLWNDTYFKFDIKPAKSELQLKAFDINYKTHSTPPFSCIIINSQEKSLPGLSVAYFERNQQALARKIKEKFLTSKDLGLIPLEKARFLRKWRKSLARCQQDNLERSSQCQKISLIPYEQYNIWVIQWDFLAEYFCQAQRKAGRPSWSERIASLSRREANGFLRI